VTVRLLAVALAAPAATAVTAQSDVDLAKAVLNPFTTTLQVPVELDYNQKSGPAADGRVWSLAVQPIIPFKFDADWSIISRTVLTGASQRESPDAGWQSDLGDTVQSFFLSPRRETRGGTYWGAGPVFLLPTGSGALGAKKWGLGPTAGLFHDTGPWTLGILANHVWSVAGSGPAKVSSTFLQPALSYTTADAWSYTLQTESTYDWVARQWSVPLEASLAKLVNIGGQQVNLEAGTRYWVANPSGAPRGWGLSFTATLLLPE
jgi:hypothetical protein